MGTVGQESILRKKGNQAEEPAKINIRLSIELKNS